MSQQTQRVTSYSDDYIVMWLLENLSDERLEEFTDTRDQHTQYPHEYSDRRRLADAHLIRCAGPRNDPHWERTEAGDWLYERLRLEADVEAKTVFELVFDGTVHAIEALFGMIVHCDREAE